MYLRKPPYEIKRNRLYGLWMRGREKYKLTFSCYLLKMMGMEFTEENISFCNILEMSDPEDRYEELDKM